MRKLFLENWSIAELPKGGGQLPVLRFRLGSNRQTQELDGKYFFEFTLDILKGLWYNKKRMFAGVVELVDTRDLKSLGSDAVPVRARPPALLRFKHYFI